MGLVEAARSLETRMIAWFGRGIDWAIDRIGRLPMTNLRQVVTLGMVIGTGVVYLALSVKYAMVPDTKEWSPGYDWLGFLALMSGLDATQFFAKRKTDATYVAAKRTTGEQKVIP